MNGDLAPMAFQDRGAPALRILVSFPIACFCCALATDIAYARTADMLWADFSAWLLAAGLVVGVLAGLAGLVHALTRRRAPVGRPVGVLALGGLVVLTLALFNNLFHTRDGWTSVVPFGLALSAATVVAILATAWLGSAPVYRRVRATQVMGART